MPSPSLSVIIPTYNRAGFVRDCLLSLREAGVQDLQIVVADDGSTDDTAAAVAETAPHATYLWNPNSGNPSAPRNAGFAASSGRYVAFLDCDDQWLPGVPARAVALLDRHPQVDVLFADARFGNATDGYVSWIEYAGQEAFARLPRQEIETAFAVLDRGPFFRRLAERNAVFIGATIVRREAFAASGGFDTTYWGGEDWELWMRMARTHTFGFLAEPLAAYTRHPGNVTNDSDKMVGGFCQALANVLARCDLAADDRRHVRRLLARQSFNRAYLAYDRGEFAEARRRFWRAIRAGDRRAGTLALWLACQLPSGTTASLRRLKQWATGTKEPAR